jgi:hypothetical protein
MYPHKLSAMFRAEVDRVIFFGLDLKINALSDIRTRMGRVFSPLGLKLKLLFGFKLRGRHEISGLTLRPRPLAVVSRIKSKASVVWVPDLDLGQGVASPVVSAVVFWPCYLG